MDKTTHEFSQIQVTKSIVIDYDISDGWFAIVDSEEHDTVGAVTMGLDEIDALIVGLGALRERVIVQKMGETTIRRKDER